MTEKQFQAVFGVAAAVCAFLLAQQDVPLDPIAKVVLGAIAVALAVVNPGKYAVEPGD